MGSGRVLVSSLPDSSPYFIIGENPNPNLIKAGFYRQIRGGFGWVPVDMVMLPCLVVMPFGMKNPSATNQRVMNSIFHNFIETLCRFIYIT